jgi:hypothetical protein
MKGGNPMAVQNENVVNLIPSRQQRSVQFRHFLKVDEDEETNKKYKVLRQLNCDITKGFFISKTMGETQLTTWLYETQWAKGWQ